MKIFITGTDTNVGKTLVSIWLNLHLDAFYYKPLQSGLPDDASTALALGVSKIIPSAYSFTAQLSPHLSSKIDGVDIDLNKLQALPGVSPLIIEGAGGLLVPIVGEYRVIDLIKNYNVPVLIVARSGLGTINHTCLTIEALRARNINILGVIMSGPRNLDNKEAIEHYGKVRVLQEIDQIAGITKEALLKIKPSQALLDALTV